MMPVGPGSNLMLSFVEQSVEPALNFSQRARVLKSVT